MDQAAHTLMVAGHLYIRAENATSTQTTTTTERPPVYKAIGISLAIASGVFIGVSFVFKKMGLLKANEKYNEEAGEGYGYLKNAFWWGGMTLMIVGEICNFVAYAFVDAILVTPLGALSVVITTILSAIFLKERLSMVGKVGCFLCIIGSVVIVMNAPSESSAANIQEMQSFVIAPGFLSYAGVIILSCAFIAWWVAPRYGKKSMLVYLSICSLIGGLSVVATQGLGAAIIAQIGGQSQFKEWFLYVLFVFVITTLVTEIIYLNKALNLFNAALVTPTYYVFFTSSTIITSAILFRGFKGTPTSIITVVMGFFVICAGVVLLQLSKSAKDVPDAAVFSGDLDQVRTIAEQAQPESEPKADAIRGAAAIVRRFSVTRQKMEMEEAKRLHEEKLQDLQPVGEDEIIEWDGLRRRRTVVGMPSRNFSQHRPGPSTPVQHPPLGMSHFPSYDEDLAGEDGRPATGGLHSSFLGSIRDRARSMVAPGSLRRGSVVQSPMHPVPLTEISIPGQKGHNDSTRYYHNADDNEHVYGLPGGLGDHKTAYEGAGGQHIQFSDNESRHLESRGSGTSSVAPSVPPHSARRQFSFHNVFRKGQQSVEEPMPSKANVSRKGIGSRSGSSSNPPVLKGATEEERLGLVKGDSHLTPVPSYGDYEDDEEDYDSEGKRRSAFGNLAPPQHQIMNRPRGRGVSAVEGRDISTRDTEKEKEFEARGGRREPYGEQRDRFEAQQAQNKSHSQSPSKGGQRKKLPSPPAPYDGDRGGAGSGAFI